LKEDIIERLEQETAGAVSCFFLLFAAPKKTTFPASAGKVVCIEAF
jgi:hypothetical protein